MHVYMNHNGESVSLKVDTRLTSDGYRHVVSWCDRWDLIEELVKAGRLTSHCHGPATYNHMEYRYV